MSSFSIETSRFVDAPADVAWAVISDVGTYDSVVATLEHTEIVSGHDLGMVRHCVDTRGREWNETCTMWDDGSSLTMTVDIESYPLAFRSLFKRVKGTWSVEPLDHGAAIVMRFDGESKLGPVGKAAVAAMGRKGVLDGIMDGYESQIQDRLARGD